MFPCMKMYIVFLNFLCFSPFYSLKEKQKIKSYDIKNCYLLSPIMKIEIIKPTQSKSKSSLVLPNTINQSILLCYYVLQCTEKENWNKELRSVFSTTSVSIYKTVKYRFFWWKEGRLQVFSKEFHWCPGRDLNPGPLALESNALPKELSGHGCVSLKKTRQNIIWSLTVKG